MFFNTSVRDIVSSWMTKKWCGKTSTVYTIDNYVIGVGGPACRCRCSYDLGQGYSNIPILSITRPRTDSYILKEKVFVYIPIAATCRSHSLRAEQSGNSLISHVYCIAYLLSFFYCTSKMGRKIARRLNRRETSRVNSCFISFGRKKILSYLCFFCPILDIRERSNEQYRISRCNCCNVMRLLQTLVDSSAVR